jgi:hypothetical protein
LGSVEIKNSGKTAHRPWGKDLSGKGEKEDRTQESQGVETENWPLGKRRPAGKPKEKDSDQGKKRFDKPETQDWTFVLKRIEKEKQQGQDDELKKISLPVFREDLHQPQAEDKAGQAIPQIDQRKAFDSQKTHQKDHS